MATMIHEAIGRIKHALDAHFESKGFEWKTQESQDEHAQAKPAVFSMVCAERNARNFPVVCPSVTIELRAASIESTDRISLDIVCHCVVVNSAILEREKTVGDGGIHHFLDEEGYTDEGVVEALFADCLLLGEETMNALRGIPGISGFSMVPPQTIDDFPYCQCQILAKSSMLTRFIPDELF